MATEDLMLDDDAEVVERTESRVLSVWLLLASAVGVYAATSLLLDKISYWEQMAHGTSPVLGCNLNPIVGCGNVINTPQASIFGNLPNPVIGVVAWSALGVLAVTLLVQRHLPGWFWLGMQVGVLGGIAMVSWLQYETIFKINALCPYCMVTWAVMIPTFWAVTTRNLARWRPSSLTRTLEEYTLFPILAHVVVLVLVIWAHFGSRLFAS